MRGAFRPRPSGQDFPSTGLTRTCGCPLLPFGSNEGRVQARVDLASSETAAGFGPISDDSEAAAVIACAEAAAPGDPLRDAYLARRQLDELERREQALIEARVRE